MLLQRRNTRTHATSCGRSMAPGVCSSRQQLDWAGCWPDMHTGPVQQLLVLRLYQPGCRVQVESWCVVCCAGLVPCWCHIEVMCDTSGCEGCVSPCMCVGHVVHIQDLHLYADACVSGRLIACTSICVLLAQGMPVLCWGSGASGCYQTVFVFCISPCIAIAGRRLSSVHTKSVLVRTGSLAGSNGLCEQSLITGGQLQYCSGAAGVDRLLGGDLAQ
jgi:hypothetical protein